MSGRKSVRIEAEEPRERQGKMTKFNTRTRNLVFPADTILEPYEPKKWTTASATRFVNRNYRQMLEAFGSTIDDDMFADTVIPAIASLMNGKPRMPNQLRNIKEKNMDIFGMLSTPPEKKKEEEEPVEKPITLRDIADWILLTGGRN
jgi:hypothetical protein